jgi:two-component system phosphate regulon sensor histidine kinase PhoR
VRFRIHHRLFAGFIGIVGLMAFLTVVLVGSGLRRGLTDTFREDLRRQLALGEWILAEARGTDPDALARQITDRVGYRVSLISMDGVVLGDSYVDPAALAAVENHSHRPEVRGALGGSVTFAQRTSATISAPLLYGARLVELDGDPIVLRLAAPLTDVERAVDRARNAVALSGLLAMLLALMVAYLASRALSQPLVQLADLSRRLASGDLGQRAPGDVGVPELDDLALAFNRLTEELQTRLSELGRERDETQALIDCMAEGVVALTEDACVLRANKAALALLDLPEEPKGTSVRTLVRHADLRRVLAESAVRPISAREVQFGDRHLLVSSRTLDFGGAVTTLLDISQIRRLEKVRRDFVANASHELKTPLTSIRGYAETLLEGDPPEHLRAGFLESIRNNALRLQRLVDDLLDLSRLESGGWVARPELARVAEAARDAWATCTEEAGTKDIVFDVEADARVLADRQGLGQIFRNLLENAVRHSEEGGHVRVIARRGDAGMVHVEVSDHGEGIPAKSLPRIFERFYRADSSRARDFGGTGLGLAIVRHLVEVMGGRVEAESELGSGTTVRFTLPAAGAPERSTDRGAIPEESRQRTSPQSDSMPRRGPSSTHSPNPADGSAATESGPHTEEDR